MRNFISGLVLFLVLVIGLGLGIGLTLIVQDYQQTKATVKAIVGIIQQSQQQAADQNRLRVTEPVK